MNPKRVFAMNRQLSSKFFRVRATLTMWPSVVMLMMTFGCTSKIPSQGEDQAISLGSCERKPTVELRSEDLESTTLTSELKTFTPFLNPGQHLGYLFEGQAGQQLNLIAEEACLWIFQPNLEILTDSQLPEDGKYIIQIRRMRGSGNTEIKLGLDIEAEAEAEAVVDTTTPETSSDLTTNPSDAHSERAKRDETPISETEAVEVIQNWLSSKSRIFAPPFDESLLSRYIVSTSETYRENQLNGGSMGWLMENNHYYKYDISRVEEVLEFPINPGSDRVSIRVKVAESLTLYNQFGNVVPGRSGDNTNAYRYDLVEENGYWKIYDYYRN